MESTTKQGFPIEVSQLTHARQRALRTFYYQQADNSLIDSLKSYFTLKAIACTAALRMNGGGV